MLQGRIRVLLLMLTDLLTMLTVWVVVGSLSALVVGGAVPWKYLFSRGGFLVIYLLLNTSARLYHGNPFYPGMALSPVSEFRRLVLTVLGTGFIFFAYLAFYGKTSDVPSWSVLLSVAVIALTAQSARNRVRWIMFRLKIGQIPTVLFGPPRETARLRTILSSSPHAGIDVRGVFDRTRDALAFAKEHGIRHGISCQPIRVFRASILELLNWFIDLTCLPEPRVFPIAMTVPVEFSGYGGLEMPNLLRQKGLRAAKRLSEFILGLLAGAVLLLPGLVIACLLGLSGGWKHIFYRASRVGKGGKPFYIWKFRTMHLNADRVLQKMLDENPDMAEEWERSCKLRNDPRITRVGKFLRKTSLDEIPQLINVLRGEMSLIGPRPIRDREIVHYGSYFYDVVAKVKPGITGFWQVSGRSDTDYDTRVALDMYYVLNWNLWLDFWILLRTVSVVLHMRGAC